MTTRLPRITSLRCLPPAPDLILGGPETGLKGVLSPEQRQSHRADLKLKTEAAEAAASGQP